MGLFDYMFDSDAAQRSDINSAARQAAAARFLSEGALDNINALSVRVREQREDIRDLTVLVSVLVKMLGEVGHVDGKALQYRVEAELEALAEASKPGEQPVTCIRCRQTMRSALTSMTEEGVICDRCLATGG
jgi:hypothetical protein